MNGVTTMEMLIKDVKDVAYEVRCLIAQTQSYKKDAERNLRNAHVAAEEGVPIQKQNDMLTSDLADAMYDFDRMAEKLQDVEGQLKAMIEFAEYEDLRQAIWSK